MDGRAEELAARPTWLFSSGPVGEPLRPLPEQAEDVNAIVAKTNARGHRLFAGVLETSRLNLAERAVVQAFRADEGDFRDWEEIDGWATEIAESLPHPSRA